MAATGWDKDSNQLIINEDLYDVERKIWKKKDGKDLKPSIQETVRSFREMVSSLNDKRTGYTQIYADTFSPSMSKDWVDWLIADLNKYIMEVDLKRAENSLEYLNSQINQTAIPELKQVMAQLIKSEQKTIMLSQSSPEYVFKILDKPIIPDLKLKPKRAIICIVGTISGFIITLLITILLIFRKKIKIT
jgi:LPS O-antigen subunit length determinant protein (WzzB/FepE family)